MAGGMAELYLKIVALVARELRACITCLPRNQRFTLIQHTVIQTLDSKAMESVLSNNGTLTGSFR